MKKLTLDSLRLDVTPIPRGLNIKEIKYTTAERIVYVEDEGPDESYILDILEDKIIISSSTAAGRYYAEQTLAQLRRQFKDKLLCVTVIDQPRFSWRGLHLDVSRHFFSVSTIKKLLSIMGHYKLNRFHWHLTDDQAWRIPIEKYPDLVAKGSWRKQEKGVYYGGSYTKEEIKEVVDFAREHFIEVIPEIELPGHARAAIAAYPELSCRQKPLPVPATWGIFTDVYCPGNDKTLTFLKDVLAEVAEMFPAKWIHIGGDECLTTRWKKCPLCQERMKAENLSSERLLQEWLMNEICTFLRSINKVPIGWDEAITDNVCDDMIAMIWRDDGREGQQFAAAQNRKMILCPNHYCYFDWKQTFDKDEKGSFGVTTVDCVFDYNPQAAVFDKKELVMGVQGNIWTERIISEDDLFYMAFPRALALAEIGWSLLIDLAGNKKRRIKIHSEFLKQSGIKTGPII